MGPIPSSDPYSLFLKFVNRNVRHWNPDIKRKEIEAYCWTTWEGVSGNEDMARLYFYVCIQERGMVYGDFLYRTYGSGAGYSGAGYRAIRRATGGKTRHWVRLHPFETNRYLARYFVGDFINASPMKWHSNTDPQKNVEYLAKVNWIKAYCEHEVPLVIADKN